MNSKIVKSNEILGESLNDTQNRKKEELLKKSINDEVKMHLNRFELEFKEFMLNINDLSKKSLLRIIQKYAAHPIVDDKFILSNDKLENFIYNNLIKIQTAKTNAMLATIMSQNNKKGEK